MLDSYEYTAAKSQDESTLVTLAIVCFNQKSYIEESIRSAFAQDYSPLEILISDDCSTDETFKIASQLAGAYQGPHKIILNRNESNMGLRRHIDIVMELSSGCLIVFQAGDDLSKADRVSRNMSCWVAGDRTADALWSDVCLIDQDGVACGSLESPPSNEPIGVQIENQFRHFIGSSETITKRLYEKFGPLPLMVTHEDRALAFRAFCAGGMVHLPQKLLSYRVHNQSISHRFRGESSRCLVEELFNHRLYLRRRKSIYLGYLEDVEKMRSKSWEPRNIDQVRKSIDAALRILEVEIGIFSQSPRERLLGALIGMKMPRTSLIRELRMFICVISPRLWLIIRRVLTAVLVRKASEN